MKNVMLNATLKVEDHIDTDLIERLLQALGNVVRFSADEVKYQPIGDRSARLWLYATSDETEPYILVHRSGEKDGIVLTSDQADLLMETGVCVAVMANYPRADRYGVPLWATHPEDGSIEILPASHGFIVAKECFLGECRDTDDGSAESFWFEIALPEDCELFKLKDKLVSDNEFWELIDSVVSEPRSSESLQSEDVC